MNKSQKRAVDNYRTRLRTKGMARFDVLGLDTDRIMIRALARRLAEANTDAERIRADVVRAIGDSSPARGGILAAFQSSPLVGAGIEFDRDRSAGRDIEF